LFGSSCIFLDVVGCVMHLLDVSGFVVNLSGPFT
jgi:hypothetical protein